MKIINTNKLTIISSKISLVRKKVRFLSIHVLVVIRCIFLIYKEKFLNVIYFIVFPTYSFMGMILSDKSNQLLIDAGNFMRQKKR